MKQKKNKSGNWFERLHFRSRHNWWMRFFTVFIRIILAFAFLMAGHVKIIGERFTDLSIYPPMGHYLYALFRTGYYYTFIGIIQVTAAILLLIPRTALLGAIIYFPIILNICILSFSVRFVGSLYSSPLMVLANLYLLCWDYDKLKFILPFKRHKTFIRLKESLNDRFPIKFFTGVVLTIFLTVVVVAKSYEIIPYNTLSQCKSQCAESSNPEACYNFCNCIHVAGQPLEKCLDNYHKISADPIPIRGKN